MKQKVSGLCTKSPRQYHCCHPHIPQGLLFLCRGSLLPHLHRRLLTWQPCHTRRPPHALFPQVLWVSVGMWVWQNLGRACQLWCKGNWELDYQMLWRMHVEISQNKEGFQHVLQSNPATNFPSKSNSFPSISEFPSNENNRTHSFIPGKYNFMYKNENKSLSYQHKWSQISLASIFDISFSSSSVTLYLNIL